MRIIFTLFQIFISGIVFSQTHWISAPREVSVGNLQMISFEEEVFISLYDPEFGVEIWKTNGSEDGTILVDDIAPGAASSGPFDLNVLNDKIFFIARPTADSREVYSINPMSEGALKLTDLKSIGILAWDLLPTSDNSFLFLHGNDLEGVQFLYRIESSGVVTELRNFGLSQFDEPVSVGSLAVAGNTLFINVIDGYYQLWKSDGTSEGTVKLKDLGSFGGSLTPLGDRIFFVTFDTELTINVSDGTEQGTKSLKSFSENTFLNMFPFKDKLVFTPVDPDSGKEIWITDGTTENTVLLKDIYAGVEAGIDDPGFVNKGDEWLFFTAKTAEHGEELWKTDGTSDGTVMVKDIVPGVQGSSPTNLTSIGDLVFFSVAVQNGSEIWSSDGTEENTRMVLGMSDGYEYENPRGFIKAGNKLLFIATAPGGKDYVYSYGETITSLGEDQNEVSASVYPNPTNGKFFLRTDDTKEVVFSVYDSKGYCILKSRMREESDIDLSTYPSGFYLIKMQSGARYSILKVIKY